jgi:hypothetical protein
MLVPSEPITAEPAVRLIGGPPFSLEMKRLVNLTEHFAYEPDGASWTRLTSWTHLPGYLRTACADGPPRAMFLAGSDSQALWVYTMRDDSWQSVDFSEMAPGGWRIACAAWDCDREQLFMVLCCERARATQLWVYSLAGHSCRLLNPTGHLPPCDQAYAAVWDGPARRLYAFGASSAADGDIGIWSYTAPRDPNVPRSSLGRRSS